MGHFRAENNGKWLDLDNNIRRTIIIISLGEAGTRDLVNSHLKPDSVQIAKMKIQMINHERMGLAEKLILKYRFTRDTSFTKKEVTVNNLVDICFKCARKYGTDDYVLYILTKKTKKEKSTVKINVFCTDNHLKAAFSDQWICTDDWSEKIVGTIGCSFLSRNDSVECSLEILAVASIVVTMGSTLYGDTNFTDFLLSTAGGSVGVHKASLAAHSYMFKTMLNGEWKETKEGRIEVPGASLQTLQALKDFLYLGTLPDQGLQILLQVAIRFSIRNLKKECIIKLSQNVKPEDYFQLLDFATDNQIVELTSALLLLTPKRRIQSACKLMIKNTSS